MPGPVVHTIIAEQLPQAFEAADESQEGSDPAHPHLTAIAEDSLRAHRTALVYGAQGPDPLFLNPDDLLRVGVAEYWNTWSNLRGQLAVKMYELSKPLEKVREDIRDASEATLDEMENRSHVIDQLTNLQARFKQLSTLISHVLKGFVKKTILDNADVFGLYISPLQTCGKVKSWSAGNKWQKDHELWSWFDILHSRRTGEFATNLLDIATGKKDGEDGDKKERPLLKSYAIGYLSHVAGDVTGHPYVNLITGGPYRLNQSQRHTSQEKIMDVWAYDRYYAPNNDKGFSLAELDAFVDDRYYIGDEVVESGLHKNFQFTQGDIEPIQYTPDPDHTLGQGPNPPIRSALKLPDEIADNFAKAVTETFRDEETPDEEEPFGELTADEVATAYRLWYRNIHGSTNEFGPVPPSELPGDVDLTGPLQEELEEFAEEADDVTSAVDDLWDALTDMELGDTDTLAGVAACMASLGNGTFDSTDVECLEAAAESINGYLSGLATAVANLAKQVIDVWISIFEIVEAIAAIPLVALNFMLQQAYEGLWACYKDLLMVVAACGFGTMYSEDLQNTHLKNMWNPEEDDAAKRSAKGTIFMPEKDHYGFPRKGLKAGHTVDAKAVLDEDDQPDLPGLENDVHLLVPFSEVEEPRTIPGPEEYAVNTPEVFINDPDDLLGGDSTTGSDLYNYLPDPVENTGALGGRFIERADFQSPDPDENEEEDSTDRVFEESVLGDAVTLTVALFKHYKRDNPIPNFNLSGDRSVAYPTWANLHGCNREPRDRLQHWHDVRGEGVPWLIEPIEPVFVPDVEEHY